MHLRPKGIGDNPFVSFELNRARPPVMHLRPKGIGDRMVFKQTFRASVASQ